MRLKFSLIVLPLFALLAPSFGLAASPPFKVAKDLEPVATAKSQKAKWEKPGLIFVLSPRKTAALKPPSLAAGQTGALVKAGRAEFATFKVTSVVDDSNLIVEYDDSTFYGGTGSTPEAASANSYTTHHYIYFWLKGFSTKGVVDDNQVIIPWVVKVTGTKKYSAATVLLIEPYIKTEKELQAEAAASQREQEEKQKQAKAELERKAAAEKARWRVWTDASQKHTVEARFMFVIGDQVKLLKKDGTKIYIPLEMLSKEDRQWLQDQKKQKKR